jgi:hypothetical protein
VNLKWVTGSNRNGWLDVRIDGVPEITSLPYGLRVDLLGTANGREQFTVLEGIRRQKTGNVLLPSGGGSQFGNVVHRGPARVRYSMSAGKVTFGAEFATAITDAINPVPVGLWSLQIPDEKHTYFGNRYLPRTPHATTWFRIGDGRDRYLHCGAATEGCVTVTDFSKWSRIWEYLVIARSGDNMHVGTIEVVR